MSRKKVIIVDDDPDFLYLMVEILSDDHDVIPAKNAEEFLELLETHSMFQPDLVIFDVNLPDTDGDVLAHQLKKMLDTQHIPVLLVSSSDELAIKAYKAGADGYLNKPFKINDFIKKVQVLMP
jgi:CheY-like chemotaxis protein